MQFLSYDIVVSHCYLGSLHILSSIVQLVNIRDKTNCQAGKCNLLSQGGAFVTYFFFTNIGLLHYFNIRTLPVEETWNSPEVSYKN